MPSIPSPGAPRRPPIALLAFAGYAVLYTLFFSPVVFKDRLLAPFDGLRFHYPHFQLARTLWDPRLGAGFPVAADPQVMTWYPPAMLGALVPQSWNGFVISAYVLASWFTFLYVRGLTRNAFAGAISGLVFGASGFMCAQLAHTAIVHTAAWLPAILFCLDELAQRRNGRWVAATAVAVGCCITAGHLQIAVYVLCAAGMYALAIGATTDRSVKFAGAAAAAMALGVALAGVQLLPALELIRETTRSRFGFAEFAGYSFETYQLVTFLFPYLFGGMDAGPYRLPYFGPVGHTETAGYVGTAALALASIAVLSFWWRRRVVTFWTALGAVAMVLALGGSTPAGRLLYLVPVFNKFRAQGRFVLLVDVAVAVLAGIGIDAIVRQARRRPPLVAASLGGLAALAVGTAAVGVMAESLREHAAAVGAINARFTPLGNPALLIPWVAGALATASIVTLVFHPRSTSVKLLVVAAIAAELSSFGLFYEWRKHSPASAAAELPAELRDLHDALRTEGGRWLAAAGVFGSRLAAPPEISSVWGFPSVSKYGPLMPERYGELLHMLPYGGVEGAWAAYDDRALDLMSVRFVAAPSAEGSSRENSDAANLADGRRWTLVRTFGDERIFENRRSLPRAWLARQAATLGADEIVQTIHTSRLPDGAPYDPAVVALVEEPIALVETRDDSVPGRAEIVSSADTRVEIETEARWPSLLVLGDLHYPGWTATVDDRPAPIVRTNLVQRGVQLLAGRHRVRFVFRPLSFRVGATVSGAAALILLVMIALPGFRKDADG